MDIQYKIIGGDQIEYGPASLAELKDWIRDGRVAAVTKVWRSDLSLWSPADRYTELLEDLARLDAAVAAAHTRVLPPAGFWARLAAWVIDLAVLTAIFVLVWTPLADARHWQIPNFPANWRDPHVLQQYFKQTDQWSSLAMPVFYPIFMLYDVFFNGRFGATIGKMAIGARITMLDGSPITYGRAFLRWLAARLSDILFLGYIMIGLRPDKRGLHDLLAGTKVVFKR